jgi:hypothetical protein
LLNTPSRDQAAVEAVRKNWALIQDAGELILQAVELPGLTDAEKANLKQASEKEQQALSERLA